MTGTVKHFRLERNAWQPSERGARAPRRDRPRWWCDQVDVGCVGIVHRLVLDGQLGGFQTLASPGNLLAGVPCLIHEGLVAIPSRFRNVTGVESAQSPP
jgi:hypothetical protein